MGAGGRLDWADRSWSGSTLSIPFAQNDQQEMASLEDYIVPHLPPSWDADCAVLGSKSPVKETLAEGFVC